MSTTAAEARYWEKRDGAVVCRLCTWHCNIKPGATGICRVRRNDDGILKALTYGRVTAVNLDPIEKKPIFHFYPGRPILSIGSWGCNLRCSFCQNWEISQQEAPTRELMPADAAELAAQLVSQGNLGIAYTYNEPFIWFEYVYDTGKLIHERGLKNVLVTNGIVEVEPLEELLPLIDAMNVDIKSMDDDFYRRMSGGSGMAARRTVELAWGRAHVEITNLIIPGENDSDEDFRRLAEWASSISRKLPVHVSRYFPAYRCRIPPTPLETLERARRILSEKLDFVYVGNVVSGEGENTRCPACGALAVRRRGYHAEVVALAEGGGCASCGEELGIVR